MVNQKSATLPHHTRCHSAQSHLTSWAAHGRGHAESRQTKEGSGLDVVLCLEKQVLFHQGIV